MGGLFHPLQLTRLSCGIILSCICMVSLCVGFDAPSYEEVVRACQDQTQTSLRVYPSMKCNAYFLCFAGSAILRNCPPGTEFDPEVSRCTMISTACKTQIYSGNYIVESRSPVHKENTKPLGGSAGENNIVRMAMKKVKEGIKDEATMARRLEGVIDSGPFRYAAAFLYAKPVAKHMSHSAHVLLEAKKMMKKRKVNPPPSSEILKTPVKIGIPDSKLYISKHLDECPYPKSYNCDYSDRYRTVDGSCNNLRQPILGRANVPHRRLVHPIYGDGVESMRESVVGGPLPHARAVSRHLFTDEDRPSDAHTLFLMTWGQFLDHDLTRTAITMCDKDEEGFGETTEVTCGYDGCQTDAPGLEACWPIPVELDDPDFGHTNKCIKFVRSEATPPLDCKAEYREQLNQVTPWIDGSNVYGSTVEEAESVRDLNNLDRGKLKMRQHPKANVKDMLPIFDDELCRDTNSTVRCFLAGDERVNENSALTTMHTVWVREHNRIEQKLHQVNPHWTGEKLFQESKRIVIAMMQHIVINEQLPLVLGEGLMTRYDLQPVHHGYYYGYSSNTDPRITQGFATAAYRFGHTLIQDHFQRIHRNREAKDLILSESFFRPVHVYDLKQGGVDSILRGLGSHRSQTYDNFFTKQVSRSLFTERPPHGPGMDLLSLNIQRSRDHGLPGYNDYREFCGLGRVSTFDDLTRDIPDNHTRTVLRSMYKHVDDIDLFPGGICERSAPGGIVGPTFGCIIGEQLRSLRKGDRFWYENKNKVGFTSEQLSEIRKMKLSKVVCTNSDGIDSIQPWVMVKPMRTLQKGSTMSRLSSRNQQKFFGHNGNEPVSCSGLPGLDLSKWKDHS